jgi:ArsR family transcriptional regulator
MPARTVAALHVRPVSRLFKALGDETRLRIVALLAHGELCVCHVQEALGIVDSRRDGTWTYYSLTRQADGHRSRQLETLVRTFAAQAVLKKDVERLRELRGPAACR